VVEPKPFNWHDPCSIRNQKQFTKKTKKENREMKKLLAVLTVLLFLAVAVSPVLAQRGRGMGPGGGWGPGAGPCSDPASSKLNLTAEQKAKVDDLRVAYLKETKTLQDKMHSKRGDLRLLWLEKTPDQEKIAATQKEIRSLRDQIQDKRTAYRLEVNKVLTPEQQAQFSSACPGGGYGPGMGKGAGRGPGYGPGYGPGPGMRGNW
jgi:Spy/CpxP family protein refolding chaperone